MRHCNFERRLLAIFVVAGWLAVSTKTHAEPVLWGSLRQGSHAVGYRVQLLEDSTRPLDDGRPRPMQVHVWYPSEDAAELLPMRYGDLVALVATELGAGGDPERAVAEFDSLVSTRYGADSGAAELLLNATMLARRDASPLPATFPVLLYAQGNMNSPHRQAVLCEYLASHGFVVLTMPSYGRITAPARSLEEVLPRAREQAMDLAFLADHLDTLSPVPTSRRGVFSYSFGARAAFLFQLQHEFGEAFVSLDGGIANAGSTQLLLDAEEFDAERFTVSLLHLHQPGDGWVVPDFELIDRLRRSNRTMISFTGLRHGDFSNSGLLPNLGEAFQSEARPTLGTECAFELVRAFFSEELQGKAGEFRRTLESCRERGAPIAEADILPSDTDDDGD